MYFLFYFFIIAVRTDVGKTNNKGKREKLFFFLTDSKTSFVEDVVIYLKQPINS